MTKRKVIINSLLSMIVGLVITILSFTLFLIYLQPFAIVLGLCLIFFGFIFLLMYVFKY